MKKSLILIIIILSLFTQNVSSKEIRSMFGFYLDLPENYEAVQNLNLNKLIQDNPDIEINKELMNEVMIGSAKGDLDIEYFFPIKYNFEFNNLYITHARGSIKEFMSMDFKDLCLGLKNLYEGLWKKKNIKQYKCIKNPREININSPLIVKIIHEGPFKGTKLLNYFFQIDKGYTTTVSLGCEIKNCRVLEKDLINVANSIKK